MRKRLPKSKSSKLIPLAGALALITANASARTLPPINLLQGEQKRPLTPEEQERQKQLILTKRRPRRFPSKRLTIPGPTFGRRQPLPLQERSSNNLNRARRGA